MELITNDISDIIDRFDLSGAVQEVLPFGNGHINDTYRVKNRDSEAPDYLLQRVNHEIFKDVAAMMENIRLVTEHIKTGGSSGIKQETLDIVRTIDQQLFTIYEGNYWRMFEFKKGTKSYEVVETPEQAYQGALAFGTFFRLLSDFPAEKLTDTLPEFHNVILRLEVFEKAVKEDIKGRTAEVKNEINFVRKNADLMCEMERLKQVGKIPLRVTHNDTKFNNVLLDDKGRGFCVIDLDTVMSGIVHYDFGDGIRTSTNTAKEDETDLSLVHFDLEKFKAFATGFLEASRDILNSFEIEYLGRSGGLLAYIMGVRFLTDYLMGDVYYKINREGHNLDRARTQLKLTRQILERQQDLKKIVAQRSNLVL